MRSGRVVSHYLGLPYSVSVTPERCTDGSMCYMARVVELPGCESHGDTPEQARHHLKEAMSLFIGSMLDDGIVPDSPCSPNGVETVWHMTPTLPTRSTKEWLAITLPSDAYAAQ